MGKQGATNAELLEDDDGALYPYANPLEAHPDEDRCRYAIRVRSENENFGNGKGVFPRGLATHLFQVGILADDNPAFPNHNDQCHILGRFYPAWCDVGYWSKQRQAFSWHFGQIESTSTWTILLDAGGKLVIDELDMQTSCMVGLFVRGSSASTGTGPDETRINYINVDETAPDNCLLVKIDSNHTGNFVSSGTNEGTITTDVIHSVKKDEVFRVTWSGGSRSRMKVTAVTDTTIEIADGPMPAGDPLPTMGSTPMTVHRSSSTSTIIGAAHVPSKRASRSRGEIIYKSNVADFDGSTLISGLSDGDLSPLEEGDYVEIYDNDALMNVPYHRPVFVGKIHTSDDMMDTITLTGDNFFGSLPDDENDRWNIVVYRPAYETPIFSFKNTYGVHRINNLRLGYGRMVRAQGGTSSHPVRTIFDGVLFSGRSVEVVPMMPDVPLGPTWMYDAACESTILPASAAARAIAMLYTTDSSDWVVGEITAAYEEPNDLSHGGKRYQSFSWRGQLNGAGKFTGNVDIRVWSTPPPP